MNDELEALQFIYCFRLSKKLLNRVELKQSSGLILSCLVLVNYKSSITLLEYIKRRVSIVSIPLDSVVNGYL